MKRMTITMSNSLTRAKKKIAKKDKGFIDFAKIQKHKFPNLISRLGVVYFTFYYLHV